MANDSRIIKTGLFGKKNMDILDSVIGQWSDGIWENTPQMAKYWKFANVKMPNGEVVLEIDTRNHDGHHYNGFAGLDDAKVKEIFGRYVKAIVKEELSDGLEGDWKRDCTSECDYLTRSSDEPITVKDAYYAYEVLKGRNVNKHPEYSEAFYAQKDDKDYQIEIELEDGPNAEDPEKLTVIVGDERETVEVPKNGTDDHYRKAIDAGLKKLGYKMIEGKLPDANEGRYPKFVQIKTMDDYNKYFVPTYGGDILKKGYQFSDLKNAWWEIAVEEEDKVQPKGRLKSMRQIINNEFGPKFIYVYSDTLNTEGAETYISEMGSEPSDYGVREDDLFEGRADEAAKKPLYAYIGYSGSWGDGDDEKIKLPTGDNYLDIASKHFDTKPEEIDAKWRKKLADCKTDADFGKILAAMYDAMEAFVFALRRGNECVWANPKGSAELDDKDWQGPDYDWLTANV